VQKTELLMSYLKLKKTNPKWNDEKISEYLNLPEVKTKQTTNKVVFSRQKVRKILLNRKIVSSSMRVYTLKN